jgi:hypothetical protein
MERHAKNQKTYSDLWEKHKHNAVTDDEGTYVNLENFNIGDHGLSMEDMRTPGNQSLSGTNNQSEEGYFMSGSGSKFRLFRR